MFHLAAALAICLLAQSTLTTGPVEYLAEGFTFTEGPVWYKGQWLFSDPGADGIHRIDGAPFLAESYNSNGITLDNEGRLIVCEQATRRVVRIGPDGEVIVLAAEYNGKAFNAPNDVIVRSDGRIFFTDPKSLRKDFDSPLGFSGVYTVDPDTRTVTLLADDIKYPNGIALSPDEKTLYIANTSGTEIRAFELAADGSVANPRKFCEVRVPDGMAVDSAGRLWVASSTGISVFDAAGNPVDTIQIKPMPTNCAFGGPDGRTLLVTARTKVAAIPCVDPGLNHTVASDPAKP